MQAEVLNQSGGKRPRGLPPNARVEVPDVKYEVFIEITHPMCAGYSEAKPKVCLQKIFFEGGVFCVFLFWKNSAVLIFLGFAALGLGPSALNLRPAPSPNEQKCPFGGSGYVTAVAAGQANGFILAW